MPRLKRTKTRHPGVFKEQGPSGWRWLVEARRRLSPVERAALGAGERITRQRRLSSDLTIEEAVMARAKLVQELAAEIDAATAPARPRSGITVSGYVARWLARKHATLRPGTYDRYMDIMGLRLLPVLGEKLCTEVTRDDVVQWTLWATEQRNRFGRAYADATLDAWWRPIKQLLQDMAADLSLPDPTIRVQRPRSPVRNVREGETLTAAQLGTLLDKVRSLFPQWYAEIYTLAFTGMRPGELYALEWDDVDEERGVIHIRRSVCRGHVSETKTSSPREVALTAGLRRVLAEHERKGTLMFPADTGGYRLNESVRKVLRLAASSAGIKVRVGPQVLRRTLNTLLVENGTPGTVIRAQIGHTTEAMTDLYAGVHPEAKASALKQIEAAVRDSQPGFAQE